MLRTSMLLGRLRIALSRSPLVRLVVYYLLALAVVQAGHIRLFWRASRSFPFKFVSAHIAAYILLAVTAVPDLNLVRVLVLQAGALAITVMFYGLARIGREVVRE